MAIDNLNNDGSDSNRNWDKVHLSEEFSKQVQLKIQSLPPELQEIFKSFVSEMALLDARLDEIEAESNHKLKTERELTSQAVERIGRGLVKVGNRVAALAIALFGLTTLWTNLSNEQRQEVAGSFYANFIQHVSPVAAAGISGWLLLSNRDKNQESERNE